MPSRETRSKRFVALLLFPLAPLVGAFAGTFIVWFLNDLWRLVLYHSTSPWPRGDPSVAPLLGAAAFRIHSHVVWVFVEPWACVELFDFPSADSAFAALLGGDVYWLLCLVIVTMIAWPLIHAAACSILSRVSSAHRARSLVLCELLPPSRSTRAAAARSAYLAFTAAAIWSEITWIAEELKYLVVPHASELDIQLNEASRYIDSHKVLLLGVHVLLPALLGAFPCAAALACLCDAHSLRSRRPFCRFCGYAATVSRLRCPECGRIGHGRRVRPWVRADRTHRAWARILGKCALIGVPLLFLVSAGALPLHDYLVAHSRWYRESWFFPRDRSAIRYIAPAHEYNTVLLAGHSYSYSDSCGEIVLNIEHRLGRSLNLRAHMAGTPLSMTFPLVDRSGGRTATPELQVANRLIQIMPAMDYLLDAPDESMILLRVYTPCEDAAITRLESTSHSGR